jgi:hypothetical protein
VISNVRQRTERMVRFGHSGGLIKGDVMTMMYKFAGEVRA